jgi:antitoxin VapB
LFLHSSFMALNIKNPEARELAAEIARLSGQSITRAVIDALRDRKAVLDRRAGSTRRLRLARQLLEQEIWSLPDHPGATSTTEDELLGYGEAGT